MMAVVSNRRSVMTLFSRPTDIHSHRTRLVLAEKNINIEIANVPGPDLPEDLMDLNPYHTVPTLVDRDLTLYDSRVIVEYLDERFPHPPLMPVDPVTRAQFRLALFRIETDWYSIAGEAENSADGKLGTKSRKMLHESIMQSAAPNVIPVPILGHWLVYFLVVSLLLALVFKPFMNVRI